MLLPPAKKQKTPACIREIQGHRLWTKVYSQKGLTAMHLSKHLWNLSSLGYPVDSVYVRMCPPTSLFWLCFGSLLGNGLCAPVWRNSAWKSTSVVLFISRCNVISCAVDSAVAQAQEACMTNMGQCCVAGTRTFVHEKIYDQFVKKSVELANARKVGDPFSADTINGPQVRSAQKLQRQVPVVRNATEDTMIYRYIIIMYT